MAGSTNGGLEQGEAVSEHDLRADYSEEGPSFEAQVKGPAVALWLCGCAFSFVGLMGLGITTAGALSKWSTDFCLAMAWTGMIVVWGTLILRGASQMWDGRQYRRAIIVAILAIAPLPCAVAGIVSLPVGVWALMVLFRPDVRAHFEAVARAGRGDPLPTDTPTRQ